MTEHEVSRTLLKSPPELWAECSDPESLARHLDPSFGEIRITRLEPETTVAWEGEKVSGTVRLEPAGWGTRVTLTARGAAVAEQVTSDDPPDAPAPVAPAESPPPIESGGAREAESIPPPGAAGVGGAPRTVSIPPPGTAAAPAADVVVEVPGAPSRLGFFERWRIRRSARVHFSLPAPLVEPPIVAAEPAPPPVAPEPAPERASEPASAAPELSAALDSLGSAHHRPFSRG